MTDRQDLALSWAMQRQIDAVEAIHSERLERCKRGETLRLSDGRRMYWKGGPDNLPTDADRQAARVALTPPGPGMDFRSTCPCCGLAYSMASVYTDIQEHGVCGYCLPYVEGRSDGVLTTRNPTVEEALGVPAAEMLPAEAWVIRAELERVRAEGA